MKTTIVALAVMALAGVARSAPGSRVTGSRGGKIVWQKDLKVALGEARVTFRPLMLYFTHDL